MTHTNCYQCGEIILAEPMFQYRGQIFCSGACVSACYLADRKAKDKRRKQIIKEYDKRQHELLGW